MYSGAPSTDLSNLKYGREMEERARENYYALVGSYHTNFAIMKTSIQIS